jgi:hypothetical protein
MQKLLYVCLALYAHARFSLLVNCTGIVSRKYFFFVQDYLFERPREFFKILIALCFLSTKRKLFNFSFEITVLDIIGKVFICFNRQ